MQVTRETIDKVPHLITDYMYEGDNVGINLTLLNTMKTKKKLDVAGIPIDYSPVSLNKIDNIIQITSEMEFNKTSKNIEVVALVKYPNGCAPLKETRKLEDEVFAQDIINTCIVDKKDIKNMQCYKLAFADISNSVIESSLNEDILVKTPELNYKCYIYSNNMELIGTANRLLEASNTSYILGEYVGKKLSEHMGRNIFIDICINDEITLQMANVRVENTVDSSLTYALLDTSNTMVKRLNENYTNLSMNIPQGFKFPEYSKFRNMNDYFEELLKLNSPKNIEKFFKDNKIKSNNAIDLNKYLIW